MPLAFLFPESDSVAVCVCACAQTKNPPGEDAGKRSVLGINSPKYCLIRMLRVSSVSKRLETLRLSSVMPSK